VFVVSPADFGKFIADETEVGQSDQVCRRQRTPIEHDAPAAVIDELKSRGHRTIRSDRLSTEFGRGQFIFKLDDGYFAVSEKRTDGQAVGF
jgi:gamma-glutamyltranspeptidase